MNQDIVFGVLESFATDHDVDYIIVCKLADGSIILDLVTGPGAAGQYADADADSSEGTPNTHLSFMQTYNHLSQLDTAAEAFKGIKNLVISAQFKDHVVVQFALNKVGVTLVSRRSRGRCLGALLAAVPLLQGSEAFSKFAAVASLSEN